MAKTLKSTGKISRVRADTFGYLQRSFPGITSETDSAEAFAAGVSAVRAALKGELTKGTISIQRKKGRKYAISFVPVPIAEAAKYTRSVPKQYIAGNKHDVTNAFLDYVRPIVGKLPKCEIF